MSVTTESDRTVVEAALAYLRSGWPITLIDRHYCKPDEPDSQGKIPLGAGWNRRWNGKGWQKKAWTDDEIERAYREIGELNVGTRLGPEAGIIDFEYDSPEEEAVFRQLFEGSDPPVTPCYDSARGKHYFYRWPEALSQLTTATIDYRGLKIRTGCGGKGAQSVLPPSVHRTGRVYEWHVSPDECDPDDVPDSVIGKLLAECASKNGKPHVAANRQPRRGATASVQSTVAAMLRAKIKDKSDGSTRLYACACRCVEHDLTDEQSVEAVRLYETERPFPRGWSDAEIVQRVRDAEKEATRGKASARTARHKIDTSQKDLALITPLAWAALQAANEPPMLFRYGGVASRIESGDKGEPILRPLEFNRMRHQLARAAEFIEWKRAGDNLVEKATIPPESVVNDVLATPDQPLPILARIVEAPVFAADGTLQTKPGYHERSQAYYVPAARFDVPDVPEQPTGQDIESARILLCDELLGEFPWVGQSELAHALALLLLPFARDLIDGSTPLHLIEKPSPGTGATLLVDMLALPATGHGIAAMTEGRDEEEWRKRITAKLMKAPPFILIDNLLRRLDSAAVSSAITAPAWEDRILGGSTIARLPVRCAWVATGNNPAVSTEIARRCVRIRLDARMDRPWLRDGFRHADLRGWAYDNRGLLTWAALTLIRAWLAAGRPPGSQVLGMFEHWARVMGGVLSVAGVRGFLENLEDFYEESDQEGANWRGFLAAWWEQFGSTERKAVELYGVATDVCLSLGNGSEQSQRVVLGKMLADRRDRVFDLEIDGQSCRLAIQRGKQNKRSYLWHLRAISG